MSNRLALAASLIEEFKLQYPEALPLAETVSLAARVEPELLRKARLVLHPGLSAGAEADVWFSSLVESSGARGFVFSPEVLQVLREQLASEPRRLQATWALLQQFHPITPPTVVLEEQVTWLTLSKGEAATAEVNQLLGQAVQAMVSTPERALGIARWAAGALPRLPQLARESDAAVILAIGTAVRVGGQPLQQAGALPNRFPQAATRVVPESLNRVKVRLRLEPGSLVFLRQDEESFDHELSLPETTPVFLVMEWTEGSEVQQRFMVVEPGSREQFPESASRLRLVAVDGKVWELSARPQAIAQESPSPQPDEPSDIPATGNDPNELRRQWETRQQTLGEAHPETLTALSRLVESLHSHGNLDEARNLLEQVLGRLRQTLGEDHSATLAVMNPLGDLLREQGELAQARMLQELEWAAAQRLWGAEDLNTLTSMNSLAQTLRQQGEFERALELQERVYQGRVKLLGEEEPLTLTALANLGLLCWEMRRWEDAESFLDRAVVQMEKVLGESHPHALAAMESLAAVLKSQGKLSTARTLLERVLAARLSLQGEEHSDTLSTLSNLASVLHANKDFDRARRLQEQALENAVRVLGEEHPLTLSLLSGLAATLRDQGFIAQAREFQQKVLEAKTRRLGEGHFDTLMALKDLAGIVQRQGDLRLARSYYERLLSLEKQHLGSMHKETLDTDFLLTTLGGTQAPAQERQDRRRFTVSDPPTIAGAEAVLARDFRQHPPPQLAQLSGNTKIEGLEVHVIDSVSGWTRSQQFQGAGTVRVSFDVARSRVVRAYTFSFKLERDVEGNLTVLEKKVLIP